MNTTLVFGGSDESSLTPADKTLDSVEEYEHGLTQPWRQKQALVNKRWTHSAVILPTGVIFIHGGENLHTAGGGPIFTPQLYDPGRTPAGAQEAAVLLATPNVVPGGTCHSTVSGMTPRVQHHVALLLPDASVFVAGSDSVGGYPQGKFTAEIYEPPYLFQGFRPIITQAPASIDFNSVGGFETLVVDAQITFGNSIERVVLLRPGAVTHQFDNDQRYIELQFTSVLITVGPPVSTTTARLTVTAPEENLGPPGYYMLFVVEKEPGTDGVLVPSIAEFIDIQ